VHQKAVGALDVGGYWRGLRELLTAGVEAGFVRPHNADALLLDDHPGRLLDRLAGWRPPEAPRLWLTTDET
jgi:predicted Rossmann-fold nucleotide-binding protein